MPIQADATTDERSSPFFKNYERIADAWNEVARKLDGSIDGVYNAYHWEATLVCRIGGHDVTAKGRREMMPAAFKLANSRNVGQTTIEVLGGRHTKGTFRIRPRSWWHRFMAVLWGSATGYSSDGSFIIVATDQGLLNRIMGKHAIIDDLITHGLRRMSLQKSGKLVLHFDDLIEVSTDLHRALLLTTSAIEPVDENS